VTVVPSAKPTVFLDYDQAALDAAYDQRVWAPNAEQVLARRAALSEAVRRRLGAPKRWPYGPSPVEAVDVYPTSRPGAPTLVFIHGGAWRAGAAKDAAYAAEMFVDAGANYVVPDFAWVQDVGGDLNVLADQVRRAIAWTYANGRRFGGDPERVYIAGHSSGGHLAGVALTTDWSKLALPMDAIKGGLCCSGMFDLEAVRLSARSSYVAFDDATEQALSPQRQLDRVSCPVVIAYASLDSPEFQRQSRDFAEALAKAGKSVTVLRGDGYNHFEIIETLANPYGLLGRALLGLMGLR
jgi:arylformamidase